MRASSFVVAARSRPNAAFLKDGKQNSADESGVDGQCRPSPYPGLGPLIQVLGGDRRGFGNLLGAGKALAREGFPAEESPPSFLEIEPAGPHRNEDQGVSTIL
jgi:hypothetical protein